MTDAVGLVVVGAFHGRGKRAGAYGALLPAAYKRENDTFETLTKCGIGFSDEDLAKLPKMVQDHDIPHRHPRVRSMLKADVLCNASMPEKNPRIPGFHGNLANAEARQVRKHSFIIHSHLVNYLSTGI
jgi:hypothetical protein